MRNTMKINTQWKFTKSNIFLDSLHSETFQTINIPHTWNNVDGQDGGNDYYRGTCWYKKMIPCNMVSQSKAFLEFRGVNSSATVYINGTKELVHDGGYSTFRVNISKYINNDIELVVAVDNSANDYVYPQRADFTFYGGIYRDVYLITCDDTHFDLEYYGGSGLEVTPEIIGKDAMINFKAYVKGNGEYVDFEVEGINKIKVPINDGVAQGSLLIKNVHLWNGTIDPYLYKANATLLANNEKVDTVSSSFGCRTFEFNSKHGFMLNGKPYKLRGVSRHQDFYGVGNAITKEMQELDMMLIKEIGANTIRLAHYQHDKYFYELCDQVGMIVWAEIPYITQHLINGNENTKSQLTELIVQNYNHPSIVCWGLSNEITVNGVDSEIISNHIELNDLAHKLDKSRKTCMAHVFMLDIEEELVHIPDIFSFNLYYGWYLGELQDNNEWFDKFNEKYPDKVVGLSEYGADANPSLHSPVPERSDYTEEYQCLYHKHLLEMFEERPYIWSTHVWNMFDFGADGRDEGGKNGQNQKGLVSFDRKYKKDAFYLYKAYWSKEPFIHIASANYKKRHEDITTILVFSNQNSVDLYENGVLVESQKGKHVFEFKLPICGTHTITAKTGNLESTIEFEKVSERCKDYFLPEAQVRNWFDNPEMEMIEGYYSIKDSIGEIKKTQEGLEIFEKLINAAKAKRGDVAKNVKQSKQMEQMMNRLSLEDLVKQAAGAISDEMVLEANRQLSKIKK